MGYIKRTAVVTVSLFLVSFSSFSGYIKPKIKPESSKYADDTAIIAETHSLYDLLYEDEEKNLVFRHPSMAMNAAQKVLSWIYFKEPHKRPDPEFLEGDITYYPVFSAGIDEAQGKRINGQYRAIETFANYVKAAARGDGSANKMLLFVGPSGTGKTYFLNILEVLATNLSKNHPDYYNFTYEWVNLRKYPALEPILNIQKNGDEIYEHPYKCPINETPINLLPEGFADAILDMVTPKIMKNIKVKPMLQRYECPHCAVIKKEILKAYMQSHDLEMLSQEQIIEALEPHVRIKRLIIGDNGTMAKLDAEPKDVDFQGLTISPNAFVFHMFGPAHPFSYYINGKLCSANGGCIFFDEHFRNAKALKDATLNVIENHEVVRGGAPSVKLDVLIIGASNQESVDEAERSPTEKAHLDRTFRVPMRKLLNPLDEAANLLSMKNIKTMRMKKLGERSAIEEAKLDQLFPLPEYNERRVGPDHRYNLWFDNGPGQDMIHLAPHTLIYIAMVAASSRLETDPKKAIKFGERHILNDMAYRDPYTRLLILMGQHTINASDLKDLRSLSRDQKEGDMGLSERDVANVWLTSAIIEAQSNNNCVTPDIAYRVFLRLLEDNSISYPDYETRLRWELLALEMLKKFLVPSLQNDINSALGAGLGVVNNIYDEVFKEILALSTDMQATEYKGRGNEPRAINKDRLSEIGKIYENINGRNFNPQEIVIASWNDNSSGKPSQHPALLGAIKSYLAERETDKITYDDLLRYSETEEGNTEVREKHHEISDVMIHEMGYCRKCLNGALLVVRQMKSRTSQVQKQ